MHVRPSSTNDIITGNLEWNGKIDISTGMRMIFEGWIAHQAAMGIWMLNVELLTLSRTRHANTIFCMAGSGKSKTRNESFPYFCSERGKTHSTTVCVRSLNVVSRITCLTLLFLRECPASHSPQKALTSVYFTRQRRQINAQDIRCGLSPTSSADVASSSPDLLHGIVYAIIAALSLSVPKNRLCSSVHTFWVSVRCSVVHHNWNTFI